MAQNTARLVYPYFANQEPPLVEYTPPTPSIPELDWYVQNYPIYGHEKFIDYNSLSSFILESSLFTFIVPVPSRIDYMTQSRPPY